MFQACPAELRAEKFGYYLEHLRAVAIPGIKRSIEACREVGVEVLFTTVEALTDDGRDQSLDYKISNILVPRGAWDAQVLSEVEPLGDEIRLRKTASSVFNATNIDYVLRNLGVERLAICGVATDQCVESAARDACDKGYLVTVITDACATFSPDRHRHSLEAIRGYCRQVTVDTLVRELTPG